MADGAKNGRPYNLELYFEGPVASVGATAARTTFP
jgi:hypothetical protein